jgi:cyclic beta-1,2-glucan synthetase
MNSTSLIDSIQEWLHLKSKASVEGLAEPPIPAQLFNADQMERHGITLALSHTLTQKSAPDILLGRLSNSETILIQSCDLLADKTDGFSPAREWLLDNFYLIQEQIHAIRRHLPKGYGRALPQLAASLPGYPRIYNIALEIIEHGDGRWDLENLSRFITAYQGVMPLTLGELWAIPITLGVALIENLSSASLRIVADRNDRTLADSWADRMIEVAVSDPKNLVMIIADMARSDPPMRSAYVAELARRLQGAAVTLPLNWIEQHLAEEGLTIEQLVQEENKSQAAKQVTVSNSIASLRRLTEVDWRDFVETMSVVDQTLRMDPSATYDKMDFGTRDRYRHVVERLSRRSQRTEREVATLAIQLAKTKAESIEPTDRSNPDILRYCHVGFYLIGKGLSQLETELRVRRSFWQTLCHLAKQCSLPSYLGSITLMTGGLTYMLLHKASQTGISDAWLWIIGIATAVYGSQLAMALVNLGTTLLVKPQPLPRMDFTKGIPPSFRTLVVVPVMLGNSAEIESLVDALEVRFLGNPDHHLHFMLLTDFNDAPAEHMPEDAERLTLAQEQIIDLNKRYAREESDVFFLCHRPRQWNASENVWMGKERKRGKLSDLNNLLQSNIKTSFSLIVGHTDILANVKYVITLDSDTQLPRESAQQLVSTMAHPLNRPRFDASLQRVVDGYGILQPRVAEALPTAGPTRYVQLCGSEFGIDPYTRTVSDVYQDVFHEGSFVGKGIYDVDLFQQVLGQRFPENQILSHDLLEGCYLRSGFLSDVPLYEKSPSSYLADAKRRIRWIRGDWQLSGWLLPSSSLSSLSKWKLFDNLRRSLVPIALLMLFGLSWTIFPATYFWFGIIFFMVLLPAVVKTLLELVRKQSDMLPSQHLTTVIQSASRCAGQLILYLACLPYEAWYSLCAILRTCWRMMISKRHLLEWTPSDQVNQRLRDTPTEWIANMWMGPAAAFIGFFVLISKDRFEFLLFSTPLLLLWLTSPFIARWLSRPFERVESKLDSDQILFLHIMARKTWDFFETFITEENHWLPPDNYQEAPVEALARRTSPTNMGLSLLANLTAYDFGYIDMHQLLERTKNALQTMNKLERYRGHFYNWYSTETLAPLLPRYVSTVDSGNLAGHLLTLRQGLLALPERTELVETLAHQAFSLAQMDMSFLYDEASHLMTIGFNVDEQRRDASSYDLLSSEARLGIFVAIAQGQVLQESWFALGRLLVSSGREPILISWSGSMFEYLMPLLVMPTYPGTLLDQTYHAAVKQQIAYGKQRGVPWGVSESGYNAVDTQYNYLYRAFGVPGLGLKRGLEDDLVIAPYASAMALMVSPIAACQNLQRLAKARAVGKFGFYEAIDFTAARLPPDSKRVLIRSFMTHHQGMSFLAFSYLLHDRPMQKRFLADPLFQATLLLLQERIPKPTASYLQIPKSPKGSTVSHRPEASMRVFNSPNTHTPKIQLLSNGNYHLVLTQAGGGYSRWKDIAVTRWREDSACDDWGLFSYVRDVATGDFWSTNYQPTRGAVENFRSIFSEAHVEFTRTDKWLDIRTEVVVSPEDDIELRRVRIHNRAKTRRTIEFTSYAEIVLAPQAADLAQSAFSNLFVETELLPEKQAILATRRPQDEQQSSPWLCHQLNVYSEQAYTLSFETDRTRFVGRGRTLAEPLAMLEKGDLSNTQGSVLDPIVAIRCQLTLEPDALVTFDLLTGMADTRPHCIALVEKYQDRNLANRIFGLAWTHGQVLLHQLNISEENAQIYGKIASAIIYTNNARRAESHILASNRRGQSGLWGYSISGDLPIVLLHIQNADNIELVQQLIQAQAYWRRKGLLVDLVILNDERISYRQTLQDQILNLITGNSSSDHTDNHTGNIIVRVTEQVPLEDRILLESVARVVLSDKRGTLKEQMTRRRVTPPVMPTLSTNKLELVRSFASQKLATLSLPVDLQFFNGLGGFTQSGDEYIIRLAENLPTPAPWANVLANPNFGTLVSESGQSYTWIENAHEFRLTPWDNDPLKDSAGETFYLRDDETGLVWSPTALPCRGSGDYQTRHGFGYSVFEHIEAGIHSELWMYVAQDAPVKFVVLKIRNDSTRRRRLSATGYVEWVLGDLRSKNAMHVVTELSETGAVLAQNYYNTEFGERTTFFDANTSHLDLTARTVTGDRIEFLGRNGTHQQPAALKRKRLSGRVGAGLDPCAAIQLAFDLAEGQSREIIFTLGAGQDRQDVETLLQRYHGSTAAQAALASTRQYWQRTLNVARISTPDPTVNLLANGWLLYQVLSSRLWGRTGYYQSGGAFGFRDQLQDVMSLPHVAPELFRAQIMLCAAHQFEEGDVQHWWHPPHNRGVRTRCSDDYLWLPFAICRYFETTGDMAILDEAIPFLQGRPLNADEESYYELPTIGTEKISLYQHAVRAIKHGLKFGAHGLPLMGSGDWNDGMNLVGKDGRGESVWLGFFLYSVLKRFAPLAVRYDDNAFAAQCDTESKKLQLQLEAHGWDGEWYRRAYFDDGTPLGSASNSECRIDSIAQSWSVLSGAADPVRAKKSMDAVNHYLVSESDCLVKLLDPPFDKSLPNPGYIEGYVPGIRENGGQYTHAAVWAAMAFAELGEKELAWKLFHILNPINHGRNFDEINRYKIEPYVTAGDIYSVAPHTGRGGWSWYTGSAGWLYRLITETLLGVQLEEGKQLRLTPMLPEDWDGFSVDYNYGKTLYKITVARVTGTGKSRIILDDVTLDGNVIPLTDDGQVHQVSLTVN